MVVEVSPHCLARISPDNLATSVSIRQTHFYVNTKLYLVIVLTALVCVSVTAAAPTYATRFDGLPVWIQMQDAQAWSPLMTPASRVGLSEAEALGEFLVPMVTATAETPASDCWAEFSVVAPKSGSYSLWGRVRFPAGTEESFRVGSTNAAPHRVFSSVPLQPGPDDRGHGGRQGDLQDRAQCGGPIPRTGGRRTAGRALPQLPGLRSLGLPG
jgi:hypothetical protein